MNDNLPEPVQGQPITAAWAHGVTDVCRRMAGVGAAGLLVRDGVGGVGFEPLPENKRERTVSISQGCFAIGRYTPTSGSSYLAVLNRFYRIGHVLGEVAGSTPPGVSSLVSSSNPLLALVATADTAEPDVTLEHYADFATMQSDAEDLTKAIIPLYLFKFKDGAYAGIEIDFRNMPAFNMTES